MRKIAIAITVVVALMLALAVPVLAGAPADKATGGVEYYQPGYHFAFNAHASQDGRPVKGEANNRTPDGGRYHAKVRCVNVIDDNTILFAAEITDTNMPSWGPWVLIQVYDGGEPGAGVDQIWGQFMDGNTAMASCNAGTPPAGGPWEVLNGNIQVHTKGNGGF
jgi:hypothetical protein